MRYFTSEESSLCDVPCFKCYIYWSICWIIALVKQSWNKKKILRLCCPSSHTLFFTRSKNLICFSFWKRNISNICIQLYRYFVVKNCRIRLIIYIYVYVCMYMHISGQLLLFCKSWRYTLERKKTMNKTDTDINLKTQLFFHYYVIRWSCIPVGEQTR